MSSKRYLMSCIAGTICLLALALPSRGDYPQPSPYPVSWELTFTHSKPQRFVVQAPGDSVPNAYWYMTYHVINDSEQDKVPFYPQFDLMTESGDVVRSDGNIKPAVFDAIKDRERIKYLQNALDIAGDLRHGEDESRDGVAIWPEPNLRMGTFTIFVSGFWGETADVKVGDKDVTLHKTMQVTYHLSSDANHPGEGTLSEVDSQFIMR